mmetsp:Transcript_35956/g.84495  ORF Transcript_35956/g.84495 Transcript_35956/m.84495 type:complete len:541 (-) Transcript_35956:159-1781(-)
MAMEAPTKRLGTGFKAEVARLESNDGMMRQLAMNNLMHMATKGGDDIHSLVELMVGKLKDSDKVFRGQAVEALEGSGHAADEDVIEALIEAADDTDIRVRCLIVNALRTACASSHPGATAKMIAMLEDPARAVREGAEENISLAIQQSSPEFRARLLELPNTHIRILAVNSFRADVCAAHPKALQLLTNKFSDPELHVRMAVVDTLGVAAQQKEANDKPMLGLTIPLMDQHIDIRRASLARLDFETARRHSKVVKAVARTLYDQDEGYRKLACKWLLVSIQENLAEAEETPFKLVLDLLESGSALHAQLAAAQVLGEVIGTGNKFLKPVAALLEHERAETRIGAVRAMTTAVKNNVIQVMWSSSNQPIVPGCLTDPDKRVRLAAIDVLSRAPVGSVEAASPLIKCFEDNEQEVRDRAADVLASLVGRPDVDLKNSVAKMVDNFSPTLSQLGKGCEIAGKYRSLEVGYTGMHEKQDFQVRGAAIRCLRKMGVPLEIIQRGAYAIEKAIDRHYLGFKYELPPNFFDQAKAEREKALKNQQSR